MTENTKKIEELKVLFEAGFGPSLFTQLEWDVLAKAEAGISKEMKAEILKDKAEYEQWIKEQSK